MNFAAQNLSDRMLDIMALDADHRFPSRTAIDRMADEIAINSASPGEVDRMPVSEQARELRRTLLPRLDKADDRGDTEAARNTILEFAEALLDDEEEFVPPWERA